MRRILAVVGIVMMLCLTGCGKFKEIKVKSVKIEKVSPYGLRGLDVKLGVNIENPAPQVKLSDMEAVVKYCGKVLGVVTVDPFTMKGRTTETYHLKAKMTLDKEVSLYDMLMFLDKKTAEGYVNHYGAERLAFGTDYPVWDPVREMDLFHALNLTEDQKEQIAWKTASRFLNL